MVVPFVYTEEEHNKLGEEIRRLLEKNKIYSNALVQEKENNKKLKEERDFFKDQATLWRNDWKVAYEENKKLEEKIRFLEQCLDNKEKVNKQLREELEKFKSTYVYDAKQVRDIC